MTWEEAIALLNEQYETCKRIYDCSADQRKSYPNVPQFMEALGMALTALRPVRREPLEKFKEYFDDLYGKGLEVYGWHMNGEAKSFDDFYEDACEYAGL